MNGLMEEISACAPGAVFKSFDASLRESSRFPLTSAGISVFQINMGRLCNLSCRHCHVEAGPGRAEVMSRETVDLILKVIEKGGYAVDITGGAPEMNPEYRRLVSACASMGRRVMTRTNLAILEEKGFEDLPVFFARNGVEVVASLPYFLEETVDRQRGRGVFAASISALKRLNEAGYGAEGGPLSLSLVYNPCGAFLPPRQNAIEADFRRELEKRFGVSFTNLFAITNMPIGRFFKYLKESGNVSRYMGRLLAAYNPAAAEMVMCRRTISAGWDGSLYDCDFNQMLGLKCGYGAPDHVKSFDAGRLGNRRVVTGIHCYGCTAGAGSSCTGAVA